MGAQRETRPRAAPSDFVDEARSISVALTLQYLSRHRRRFIPGFSRRFRWMF